MIRADVSTVKREVYISCCLVQRFRPTREFQLQGIRGQLQGRLDPSDTCPIKESVRHTWCTSSDSLSIVALTEKTVDTTDWECETSLGRSRLGALSRSSFSARFSARHDVFMWVGLVMGSNVSCARCWQKCRETNVTARGAHGIYIIPQSRYQYRNQQNNSKP